MYLFLEKVGNTRGAYLWKHSHNHVFENIKLVDLDYGITVSKLVESGNGDLKTRNNGVTPWYFIDLTTENVTDFYEILKEINCELNILNKFLCSQQKFGIGVIFFLRHSLRY